ncbi:MAG: CopG family transcriptional regulator [Thermoanaerobaculia bacterium]
MRRTTIMLPADLQERAMRVARRKGVSLASLIRDSLDAALPSPGGGKDDDPLFEEAVFQGPAPADLAAEHDHHLYDEEP